MSHLFRQASTGGLFRQAWVATALAAWLTAAAAAAGGPAAELDYGSWQRVPVFYRGRIMPLDSFARSIVRELCGKEKPTLRLAGAVPDADLDTAELAGARRLFPHGGPQKFEAAELLYSWLVVPQWWQHVPFLHAEHEQLRELLGVALRNSRGDRLKFVSPYQIQQSFEFQVAAQVAHRKQQLAETRGERYRATGIDQRVLELNGNYETFLRLSGGPLRLHTELQRIVAPFRQQWQPLATALDRFRKPSGRNELSRQVGELFEAVEKLLELMDHDWFEPAAADRAAARVAQTAAALAETLQQRRQRLQQTPPEKSQQSVEQFQHWMDDLIEQSGQVARWGREVQQHLPRLTEQALDQRHPLRVLPALDADGLLATSRDRARIVHPWWDFNTVIFGSAELRCARVPEAMRGRAREALARPLTELQQAFAASRRAYLLEADDPARPQAFARALERFESQLGVLGREVIEPLRLKLPVPPPEADVDLALHAGLLKKRLEQTAYPAEGEMDLELHYNHFAPFLKSWITSLAAVVALALSFGVIRRPMFWIGMLLLVVALLLLSYGLLLRFAISGWVPVTNMYESVVFVALTVCFFGLWFTLLPLFWPGLRAAWQWTAWPVAIRQRFPVFGHRGRDAAEIEGGRGSQPAAGGREDASDREAPAPGGGANWLLLVPRAALMVCVFYAFAIAPYSSDGVSAVIRLWPRAAGSAGSLANNVLSWVVGLGVLLASVLWLPRIALTIALWPLGLVRSWLRGETAGGLQEVQKRKPLAIIGALVGCLTSIVAYFAPVAVMPRDLGTLRPALHSNFWLTLHVLPITASYGAGALAWGLGNISLGYYLFGRYREGEQAGGSPCAATEGTDRPQRSAPRRRPPRACEALAAFIYRAILVAVLLLIAGTILGALWADVAWGRFWGWDNKEVWSLISILAYMIILHGRYAGWSGHFGLAAGSVLGMTCILIAWYGVNFLLPGGLHSYGAGSGTGGQLQVAMLIVGNWLFLAAAATRYRVETRLPLPQAVETPK